MTTKMGQSIDRQIIMLSKQIQSTISWEIQIALIVVGCVSSGISLLVPALYFIERKCREHPTPLIVVISLLEAVSNYNIVLISLNIYNVEHFVHIKNVFDFLTFNQPSEPSDTDFCELNFLIYILLELLSIGYNLCFSIDLLVTLKIPFFAGRKRMKFYHLLAIGLVAIALPLSIYDVSEICTNEFRSLSIYKVPLPFLISLLVFNVLSFLIMIMSFQTTQLAPIRRRYIHHHRIILITLMLVWLFPILANLQLLITNSTSSEYFTVINIMSFFSLLASGGIINVVRFCNDPYIWSEVKKMFRLKRRKKEVGEKEVGDESDVWNLPLGHAIGIFQNQEITTNLIQIVLQTCVEEDLELEPSKKQSLVFSNANYFYPSSIIEPEAMKQILHFGSIAQLKRLTAIRKSLKMICKAQSSLENKSKINSTMTIQSIGDKKNEGEVTISVESFADPLFCMLRDVDGLNSRQLQKTLDVDLNSANIKKAQESLGASGSFFFFTHDHKLVIKTIPDNELETMLKLLPSYYQHIGKNPRSLLSRVYGLFSVQIGGISRINFIMMENTLEQFNLHKLNTKIYDLKGSTKNREVKDSSASVLKDINYLHSNDSFIFMSESRKQQLYQQIKQDITLLRNENIMDYSLLVGVAKTNPHGDSKNWRYFKDGQQYSGKVYGISIIDYLQEFNMTKYMELTLKRIFKGGGDISSIDTEAYYQRFLHFVSRMIVITR